MYIHACQVQIHIYTHNYNIILMNATQRVAHKLRVGPNEHVHSHTLHAHTRARADMHAHAHTHTHTHTCTQTLKCMCTGDNLHAYSISNHTVNYSFLIHA